MSGIGEHIAEGTTVPFGMETALGLVTGSRNFTVSGIKLDLGMAAPATVWGVQGNVRRKRLHETGAVNLYVSSDNVADTTQVMLVLGLDANYKSQTGIAVLNGQSQVEVLDIVTGLPITWFIVDVMLNSSGSAAALVGEIYIAESTALTGGIPNDLTACQGKIVVENGDSRNVTHNGFFLVPAGKTWISRRDLFSIGKNKDANIDVYLQDNASGFPIVLAATARIYQNTLNAILGNWLGLTEKTYFEFVGVSSTNNTEVFCTIDLTEFDNELFHL